MKMNLKSVATAFLVVSAALPAFAADYYLYEPHKTEEAKIPAGESGVLVKEITIKWGDTLYGLSRQYGRKGSYYPQILLFNNIKNPDLIYAGKKLRVPVQHAAEGQQVEHVAPQVKKGEKKARKEKAAEARPEVTAPAVERPELQGRLPAPVVPQVRQEPERKPEPPVAPKAPSDQDEQRLYRQGILLFKQGDYRGALAEFDQFLSKYPNSDLAADVTLYRAESLLKMASQ